MNSLPQQIINSFCGLTHQELQQIVAQAMPLFERADYVADGSKLVAPANKDGAKFWQKWSHTVANGDMNLLSKRLAWEGNTIEHLNTAVYSLDPEHIHSLPNWSIYLNDAIKACRLYSTNQAIYKDKEPIFLLSNEKPLPYEDIFTPFVVFAREKLKQVARNDYQELNDQAHATLEYNLLSRLTSISAHCLELEFSVYRLSKQSSFNRFLSSQITSKTLYEDFVIHLMTGGMVSFFKEYSVLARLVGTAITFWVEAIAEFLGRLAKDRQELTSLFSTATEQQLGQVIKIHANLSDPHNQGRTVFILTFASEKKVVYKPKSLGLEEGYFQFLSWLNKQNYFPPFKILSVINKGLYGWCEFVEHLPCQSEAEVQRYYYRAGILLAWLYTLEATDCHFENIIASGEHPVLIDLETIIHQRTSLEQIYDEETTESQTIAHEYFKNSVFRTGFLPIWEFGADGTSFDGSGLGSIDDQAKHVRVVTWDAINTDKMRLTTDYYRTPEHSNVPRLNGQMMPLNSYIDDFIQGFQQTYSFIMKQQALFLSEKSPLKTLFSHKIRYIFRNTSRYVGTMRQALHPRSMRDGISRSILLDSLNKRPLQTHVEKPFFAEIVKSERVSMENLDVPYFAVGVSSRDVVLGSGQVVKNYFPQTAVDLVHNRIQALNYEDLDRQINFIKASLYARITRPSGEGDQQIQVSEQGKASSTALTADNLTTEAIRIAKELTDHAIHANDGSLSWVALGYILQAHKYRLQPMDYDLYNGSSGIGLFFAALASVTGEKQYTNLANGTFQLTRQHLHHSEVSQRMTRRLGLGAAVGISSIIYTLVRAGLLLKDSTYLSDAMLAAQLITPDIITKDKNFDLARGAAGAILAITTLYETTGDKGLLKIATNCADYLLANRTSSKNNYQVWCNPEGKLLTGMLHGAAGFAYALLRLYAHRPDKQEYQEAALQAIAYENSLYTPEKNNWILYEGGGLQDMMTTWCHGAPGIGLARLGSQAGWNDKSIQDDILSAITSVQELGVTGIDHLCCGNFGRIDLLIKASHASNKPAFLEQARLWASWMVDRASKNGQYFFSPDIPRDVYQPALFTGTSGVGYMLLRLAHPELLPSIMLWE